VGPRLRAHRLAKGARAAAGLAFGVASKRYIEQASQATARGLYFDMVEFEEFVHKNQTPSTPAISLLYATAVQGEHIARETIDARWARHTEMAEMTHAWVRYLREETGEPFCVYAPEHARSGTVTAIALPAMLKGDDIVKGVAKRGFVIGSGYGKLKSSTFRIGHMGDHTSDRLALCLEATADTIRELLAK
jgi:aspartate aminotransferase-like enzyme